MVQDLVHRAIIKNRKMVDDWFIEESKSLFFPFYSSFDIRDSSFKVAPVDANIFPAGFNNICPTDQDAAIELVKGYFAEHFPGAGNRVILLTEEHTGNPFYWDNVRTLQELLQSAGMEVRLAIPREIAPTQVQSASGATLNLFGAQNIAGKAVAGDFAADIVISNNDFSIAHQDWVKNLETPINPPYQLGWHSRRKDEFFKEYNDLARQFCELIQVDPWLLQVDTTVFAPFEINEEESRARLAEAVDGVLKRIKATYLIHGISEEPFVFIKNNSGTYGLGVTQANSGQEVREWSYKIRKKMKAAKGGRDIDQVIIQEGIPTSLRSGSATAEPTIYMIGCQLAGGFLRTHESKGPRENLNSPGAVFKRLCVSDLKISVEGHPMENVYGWLARLGFLAIAREAQNHSITCADFLCRTKA